MSNEDLVLGELAKLPAIAVEDLHGERVRRLAHRALQQRRTRRWRRFEPAFAYAVGAAYLLWAVQAILG